MGFGFLKFPLSNFCRPEESRLWLNGVVIIVSPEWHPPPSTTSSLLNLPFTPSACLIKGYTEIERKSQAHASIMSWWEKGRKKREGERKEEVIWFLSLSYFSTPFNCTLMRVASLRYPLFVARRVPTHTYVTDYLLEQEQNPPAFNIKFICHQSLCPVVESEFLPQQCGLCVL